MVSVHTIHPHIPAHRKTKKRRKKGKKKGRKDERKNEGRKEGKESPAVSFFFFSLKEKCTLTFRRQQEPGISGTWDLKPFSPQCFVGYSVSHSLSETRAARSLIDFGLFLSSKLKEPRV